MAIALKIIFLAWAPADISTGYFQIRSENSVPHGKLFGIAKHV